MWGTVEPDKGGFFTLYVKVSQREDEREIRKAFGKFGYFTTHRPATSKNLFLQFKYKQHAERALNNMKDKYFVVAAHPGKSVNETSCKESAENYVTDREPHGGREKDLLSTRMPRLVPARLNNVFPFKKSMSPAQVGDPAELQVFKAGAYDDMPEHADEMFIANISEYTTAEDLLILFASLQPLDITPLKYTDIKAHLAYRIITFSTCKAVTYALKYYQNFYLHGKYWYLSRFSTLIEMGK